MRALKLTHLAFAVGSMGLGALSLLYGDFVQEWQPVSPGFPWRHGLAYASGAFLLVGGIGLLVKPVASRCAVALTGYQLIWVLALGAEMVPDPANVVGWLTFGQGLLPAIGSALLAIWLNGAVESERVKWIARMLLGLSCLFFGLSHFTYTEAAVAVIPRWLPGQVAVAYLTGVAHVAAGVGLLTGILARLAATLEALMLASFVLLVHLPSVFASPAPDWAPNARTQWTEVLMVLVVAASAGLVAHSLRNRRWGLKLDFKW
jgi:uncharacterized membrane protein